MLANNNVTRLLVWYSLFTAIFRCPSSYVDLTEQSPAVCKPYLIVRSSVTPYIEPYYAAYAAPYVDAARPYGEKLHEHIYSPAVKYGKHAYEAYGSPQVEKTSQYVQMHWAKTLKPQIDATQVQAKIRYQATLAPYVTQLLDAVDPYYSASRSTVLDIYNQNLVPAYKSSRPYIEKTYALGHKVTVETCLPYTKWALYSTMVFLDRTVRPKLRILYGENVEPQLMRIGERLGRYRDGKKLRAAVEEIDR